MVFCHCLNGPSAALVEVSIFDLLGVEHTHEPTPEELQARRRCLERRKLEEQHRKKSEERDARRHQRLEAEATRLEELFREAKMREKWEIENAAESELLEVVHTEALRRAENDRRSIKDLMDFLKKHDFHDVDERKVTFHGWCYPLHVAVLEGDVLIVRLLLKAGANPRVRSTSGSTPLDKAKRNPDLNEIVALLEKAMNT